MNHTSIKRLFVLAILTVCAAVPTTGSDCDDPLGGGSCQNQNMNSNDSGAGNGCGEGPITVTNAVASGATLVVGLSNSSDSTEQAFVVAEVMLQGRPYIHVTPVSLTSGLGSSVVVRFPGPVTPIGVVACGFDPGGINEGPDVVGMREEEEAP